MRGRSPANGQDSVGASVRVFGLPVRFAGVLLASVPLSTVSGRVWAQAAGDTVGSLFAGGTLRGTLEGLLPNRPRVGTGLGWTTEGSIGVFVGATDNPGALNNQYKPSLTTLISPSISIAGDSPRLQAQFAYSPQIVFYSADSSQN